MSFELEPGNFDDRDDISQIIDYLQSSIHREEEDIVKSRLMTPEEWTVYGAKMMALSWIQYCFQDTPPGRICSMNELVRYSQAFSERVSRSNRKLPALLDLAGQVAGEVARIACKADTMTEFEEFKQVRAELGDLMDNETFAMKMHLLVDRFRQSGFELPETKVEAFDFRWGTWTKLGPAKEIE